MILLVGHSLDGPLNGMVSTVCYSVDGLSVSLSYGLLSFLLVNGIHNV
jgi:hypothetical protein